VQIEQEVCGEDYVFDGFGSRDDRAYFRQVSLLELAQAIEVGGGDAEQVVHQAAVAGFDAGGATAQPPGA
jgi:hypothetical protein